MITTQAEFKKSLDTGSWGTACVVTGFLITGFMVTGFMCHRVYVTGFSRPPDVRNRQHNHTIPADAPNPNTTTVTFAATVLTRG